MLFHCAKRTERARFPHPPNGGDHEPVLISQAGPASTNGQKLTAVAEAAGVPIR